MPIDKEFVWAIRTSKAPLSETKVSASPVSKSLNQLTNKVSRSKSLKCEITYTGHLRIDISKLIHGDRIKISKRNAVKFANWILSEYRTLEAKTVAKASHKDKVDR